MGIPGLGAFPAPVRTHEEFLESSKNRPTGPILAGEATLILVPGGSPMFGIARLLRCPCDQTGHRGEEAVFPTPDGGGQRTHQTR